MVLVHKTYVILLLSLENHIFAMFRPYSILLRPSSGQSGPKFNFWSNFPINTINKVNGIIVHRNNIILLPDLENHVFPMVFPIQNL